MAQNTIDVIIRLNDQLSNRMGKINAALNALDKDGNKANTTMGALGVGLKGLAFGAVVVGVRQMVDAFSDVAKAGASFERVLSSFQVQSSMAGQNYIEVLGSMRHASRNTVSDMELMISANKAFSLGVATTGEELAQLVKVSTALGRRTGLGQEQSLERLLVGIGRQSPRILDDLGIAVNLTRLFREETGKSSQELEQSQKIQILLNKVLKDGADVIAKYPKGLDDASSAFERMGAIWSNMKADLGRGDVFQGAVGILDDLIIRMNMVNITKDAQEGKAGIDEMKQALQYLEDLRASVPDRWWANHMLKQGDIRNHTAAINQLQADLNRATSAKRAFDEAMVGRAARDAAANPARDYMQEMETYGKATLDMFQRVEGAQARLSDASAAGNAPAIAQAQVEVQAFTTVLEAYAEKYNEAAENAEKPLIDIVALRAMVLQIYDAEKAFDIFAVSEAAAKTEADALAESQKKTAEALKEVQHEYLALADAKRAALQGDVLEFQVANPGGAADQAARTATATLKGQLEYIERVASAWMTEEQAVLAVARAYEAANGVLDNFNTAKERAAQVALLAPVGNMSGQVLTQIQAVADAMNDLATAGTGAEQGAASKELEGLRRRLEGLVTGYNRVAEAAGLDLVDIDAAKRGELAVENAAGAVDIFNQAQQLVPTYAQMAGSALDREKEAFDAFTSAISGSRVALMNQIAGFGDVLNADQMTQMYTEGLEKLENAEEGIVASEDDMIKKFFELKDAQYDVTNGFNTQVEALRKTDDATSDLADTVTNKLKAAYDGLNSVVAGELKDALNELSNVGINMEDELPYQDAPAENARRLAAIMKEGIKDQSWLDEFKAEVPGVWAELTESGAPQEAAAQMLRDFQLGLRPELIDFEQLKQQIRDKLATQFRIEDMGKQITNELITEMGDENSASIQRFVADALGLGLDESGFGADSAAKLLSEFTSQDFRTSLITAGATGMENWAAGFVDAAPEHMMPFIDLLVNYVTPGVEAKINAKQSSSKAK